MPVPSRKRDIQFRVVRRDGIRDYNNIIKLKIRLSIFNPFLFFKHRMEINHGRNVSYPVFISTNENEN